MSQTQVAFLEKAQGPDRQSWEAAIRALGFDFTIDEEYQPFTDEGFLPCQLNNRLTGFELYFEKAETVLIDFPHLSPTVGNRDVALLFRWSSRWLECASIMLATAALMGQGQAVVHYCDDDHLYSSVDELLAQAREALSLAADEDDSYYTELPPATARKPWWKFW